MAADGWVITIVGPDTKTGTAGYDSMMIGAPAGWYATVRGRRGLLGQVAGHALRQASMEGAARVGERLHHADWVITGDRVKIREIGMAHGCPECAAGTERALAWLDDHPGGEVACGLLHWAAPEPPGVPG